MIGVLAVHIVALICWAGSLLYLPALIALMDEQEADGLRRERLTRKLYTFFVTPAALIAIISGTALFLVKQLVAGWLVAKLTLVSGLVLCHLANGWLINYAEKGESHHVGVYCALVGLVSAGFMAGIIYLVLAKPF